jgi:hypothetical protein
MRRTTLDSRVQISDFRADLACHGRRGYNRRASWPPSLSLDRWPLRPPMRTHTHKCREHGHLEISVECEDTAVLSPTLHWFLRWIESEVAGGRRFLPEQTVQVGWSVLEIRQRADGTLALFEPDFQSMPLRFVDSVSNTLLHLFLQKNVADSLGLGEELALPSFRDSAIVCTEFGSAEGFIMSRVTPKTADSGWFIGCDNAAHDHQSADCLRRVSLYEAVTRYDDRTIPFLALPPDSFVGFGGAVPCFSRGETELAIRPGSYLHKKYVENVA